MMRGLWLLATLLPLAGCGAVGDVLSKTGQILMDPSVPVGPVEDHPTQIGLSLHAAADVNPNPLSVPEPPLSAEPDAAVSGSADGPFELRLQTANRRELIESLRNLLGDLEDDPAAAQALTAGGRRSTRVRHPVGATPAVRTDDTLAPVNAVASGFTLHRGPLSRPVIAEQILTLPPLPLALIAQSDVAAADDATDADGLFNADSLPGADGLPGPDGLPGAGAVQDAAHRGIGQYGTGPSFTTEAPTAAPAKPESIATPVAFKVLQLKDDSLLLNADPLQLASDLKKVLGSTLLTQDDYLLLPGQFKYLDFAPIEADTRYIAIVADFHEKNGAIWKQALRIEPKGRRYALLLTLQGNRVGITDESYRPPTPSAKP